MKPTPPSKQTATGQGALCDLLWWGCTLTPNVRLLALERVVNIGTFLDGALLAAAVVIGSGVLGVVSLVSITGLVLVVFAATWLERIGRRRYREVSDRLGLSALVLRPLTRRQVERLYGIRLHDGGRTKWFAEVHAETTRRWRREGESAEEAASRFQAALWEDYRHLTGTIMPAHAGWGWCVSTWHRLPPDLLIPGAEAYVLEGARPGWLPPIGERHRKAAQRRLFGRTIGAPVNRNGRWKSVVFPAD